MIETMDLFYKRNSEATMDDTPIGNSGESLFDYAYGKCDIFALALAEKFGYTMKVIWNLTRNGNEKGIVHAYAVKVYKGQVYYYDAHGSVSFMDFREYVEDEMDIEGVKPEFLLETVEDLEAYKRYRASLDNHPEEALIEIEKGVGDVKEYLKEQTGMYVPIYSATSAALKSAGWNEQSVVEGEDGECVMLFERYVYDCQFELRLVVCSNHSYRYLLFNHQGESVYEAHPETFEELLSVLAVYFELLAVDKDGWITRKNEAVDLRQLIEA